MARLIVNVDLARAALLDRLRDGLDVAVEQVDLATGDAQPSAADDPWTPAADRRHLRCFGRIRE